MSAHFKDQFSKTSEWFSSWNECEQVVALYNLIKKMSPTQACFLSKVLPQLPSSNTSLDIELLEYQSNDPNFIANLGKEFPEVVIKELVKLLPLLKPCSFLAAKEYVKLISLVLMSPSFRIYMVSDMYQIIFYLSLHTSVSKDDLHQLHMWLNSLDKLTSVKVDATKEFKDIYTPSDTLLPLVQVSDASSRLVIEANEVGNESEMLDASQSFMRFKYFQQPFVPRPYMKPSNSLSYLGEGGYLSNQNMATHHQKLNVNKSLSSNPNDIPKRHQALTRTSSISSSFCSDWISHHTPKGNSPKNQTYLTAEHAPLSPQSSGASTGSGGSESHALPEDVDPAMIDISIWLKSLRLHKYLYLFEKLTYNEMVNLTDEWLAGQGVTKGARNKILVHIKKLQERSELVKTIEKNILNGQDLDQCVANLKPIIFAPISSSDHLDGAQINTTDNNFLPVTNTTSSSSPNPSSFVHSQLESGDVKQHPHTENLPSQISRVLGKLCSQLLVATCPDTDCLLNYLQLLERCSNHSSFSTDHKKKINFWKLQIQNTWNAVLNKHPSKCKTSHAQNLAPPFNKSKSKLASRYSNPIHSTNVSSQAPLPPRPSLLIHHLQPKLQQNPSQQHQQLFGFPPSNIFSQPPLHPPPSSHQIHLQHRHVQLAEVPPLFNQQTLNTPPQLKLQSCNSFPHDNPADGLCLKMPLGRTQSAPLTSPDVHKPFVTSTAMVSDSTTSPTTEDIHANLESLCINMMEHAMGNSND